MVLMRIRRASTGFSSKIPAWGWGRGRPAEARQETGRGATEMTLGSVNRAGRGLVSPTPWVGANGFRSNAWEGPGRRGVKPVPCEPWSPVTPVPLQPLQDDGLWGGRAEIGGRGRCRGGPRTTPRTPHPGARSPSARAWPGSEPELEPAVREPGAAELQPRAGEGAGKPAGRGPQGAAGPFPSGAALPGPVRAAAGHRSTEREARGVAGPECARAVQQPGFESRAAGRAGRSRGPVRCRKGRGGTAEKVVPNPLCPGGERGGGAERAALQAAFPGPGEPAGARGTGSERCAEGEIGAPVTAGPSPIPKGATWARARHDNAV